MSAQDELQRAYTFHVNNVSDIYEHLPTLSKYASECDSVVEFGVRSGVATTAFIHGLSKRANTKYYGVDVEHCQISQYFSKLAPAVGVQYTFTQNNSILYDIPEDIDLLFIDSWHVYGHLKRELAKHHSKVRKYIIMHDTTVDEWDGESIRSGWNTAKQAQQTGYPEDEIRKGLWPAITEFLEANPEWELRERFTNNCGLTVLQRREEEQARHRDSRQ